MSEEVVRLYEHKAGEAAANRIVDLCRKYVAEDAAGLLAHLVAQDNPAYCHAQLDIIESIFKKREAKK